MIPLADGKMKRPGKRQKIVSVKLQITDVAAYLWIEGQGGEGTIEDLEVIPRPESDEER